MCVWVWIFKWWYTPPTPSDPPYCKMFQHGSRPEALPTSWPMRTRQPFGGVAQETAGHFRTRSLAMRLTATRAPRPNRSDVGTRWGLWARGTVPVGALLLTSPSTTFSTWGRGRKTPGRTCMKGTCLTRCGTPRDGARVDLRKQVSKLDDKTHWTLTLAWQKHEVKWE